MIVPWTVITEDKSTWPPIGKYYCLSWSYGSESVPFIRLDNKKVICIGTIIDESRFFKIHINSKWRPMPKLLKKKNRRCSGQYSGNVFYHHYESEQLVRSDSNEQKSPWKSCEILPKNKDNEKELSDRAVIIKYKPYNSGPNFYSLGCYQPLENKWLLFSPISPIYEASNPIEWMEIPK